MDNQFYLFDGVFDSLEAATTNIYPSKYYLLDGMKSKNK